MTDQPAWYESFFGPDYLEIYSFEFTDELARMEAGFVARALGLQEGQRVLDLCCGQGRHAVLLASMGFEVTGLDLSEQYLRLASEAAEKHGLRVETVHADMRDIPFESHFDAVYNVFSSFGYLESETEDAKVLEAIRRALKPGGRVLLDMLNRDWLVNNYVQDEWRIDENERVYLEHRELDLLASRNHVTFMAIDPDGTRRDLGGHHIRLYTLREVAGMLEAAGLKFEAVYGGFEGQDYGIKTRRMIVVASRPNTP